MAGKHLYRKSREGLGENRLLGKADGRKYSYSLFNLINGLMTNKYYKPLNHCVYQCDTALKTWFKTDGSREIILSSPIELYCINKPNCMKHAFLLLCFLLLTPPPLPNTHTPPNFSSPSKNVTHNPPKENPLVNRTTEYAVKFHTV